MKTSNPKVVLLFMALVIAGAAIYSCKKSTTPPDPNLSIVVNRQIVVSAINPFSGDSIAGFTVAITTPTATINQTVTGNTYVIKDPVAGNYTIVVSKTGYTTTAPQTFAVVLPTDAKTSLNLKASIPLSKAATAIVVTSTSGGAIPVSTFADAPSSAVVANVTVAPATVFTLADGTKPASVNISVTNVPVVTQSLPVTNNQVVASSVAVVKDKIALQTLDLQPEGMTFDKPMVIDVNIANKFPASMSLAQKTALQNSLTLNYTKKDGTVEVISPDHFSTDRNTVYYKISHFSSWTMESSTVSFVLLAPTTAPAQSLYTPTCNATLTGSTFTYSTTYSNNDPSFPMLAWYLTGNVNATDVKYSVTSNFDTVAAQSGVYSGVIWGCYLENWQLTVTIPGSATLTKTISIPKSTYAPHNDFPPCHQ